MRRRAHSVPSLSTWSVDTVPLRGSSAASGLTESFPHTVAWPLILRFLSASTRYKVSHVCRSVRELVLSREWEVQAMLEALRLGARLKDTIAFPPFPSGKIFRPLNYRRMYGLQDCVESWHLAHARVSRFLSSQTSCLVPGFGRADVSISSEPGTILEGKDDDTVLSGCYLRGEEPLQFTYCLQTAAYAWEVLGDLVTTSHLVKNSVDPRFAMVALLQAQPHWREVALARPMELELWTYNLVSGLSEAPVPAEAIKILDQNFSDLQPAAFFSWEFICNPLGCGTDTKGDAVKESCDKARQKWLKSFIVSDIKALALDLGFKPYVDSLTGIDLSKNQRMTYIHVKVKEWPYNCTDSLLIELKGDNTCNIRFTLVP
eukprot:Protomagalhaensia_wolfi_Nauph_80__1547@NODE_1947_length_1269_cov_12_335772_g1524_i0_p1_GENE_NODE_1947_length_1269_cov_12_335772_g1524_i0NODE_1947_length_1269_cov_12_335772_g1524_i0_p1_ORF_typecomplete_len374_score61_07Fboxlike/PF12937_7/0_0015Fboxlike/PF12937_7/29Fbox/PF00646_33/0_075_NODE_1947_length_1269_cov_12_335772_g1524_i01151236